jgi:glycosyltransferase involved in cell wall biosynthesis
VGGLQGLVRDGDTGLFIDPNATDAAEDLAAKLGRLAADRAWREKLGEAGRREARANYDWPMIGRQLETLYQRAEEHCARRP